MISPVAPASPVADAFSLAYRGMNRLAFLADALESLGRGLEDDQLTGLSSIIADAYRETEEGVNALRELAEGGK